MVKVFPSDHQLEIGKGITVRDGKDVTVIMNGHMLSRSLEAADILAGKDIDARVVNMHTVKPLDTEIVLRCARETGAIVTAEEHSIIGGLGSAVAEILVRELPVPMEIVGINDTFAETALDHDSLLDHYGMSVNDIVNAAEKAISRKNI
jgi:transketolase